MSRTVREVYLDNIQKIDMSIYAGYIGERLESLETKEPLFAFTGDTRRVKDVVIYPDASPNPYFVLNDDNIISTIMFVGLPEYDRKQMEGLR